MFPNRGVQLVVYHGVLLVGAGREGEGGAHLDLGGHVAGDVEQDRVAAGARPHEDGHLVCRGLAGDCRLGACGLLKERSNLIVVFMLLSLANSVFTCWLLPVLD